MNASDTTPIRRTVVSALLLGFAAWDLVLFALAVIFPDQWFLRIHGVPRVDPQALLARTGLVWLAFSVFHLVAFFRWKQQPHWLVIVGGMRLAELFADLGYLLLAQDATPMGRMALSLAAPTNVFFAMLFIQTYLEIAQTNDHKRTAAENRVAVLELQLAQATEVKRPECPPMLPIAKIVGTPSGAGAGVGGG